MSVGDIADFEARLAEDDITFDFARGLLDALEASRAEVATLRRQLEERGDAIPEFDVNKLDGLEGAWAEGNLRVYIAGARAGWEKCASLIRIPPGEVVATPPPDVVTVPREYLEMLQSAANRFCSSCRHNNASCSMTARHFGGTGCGAWQLDGTRINALRSGEAGNGAG